MSTILNLAIGLVFVFLLFSLVVSALNEMWLTFLDRRSDFLQEGLREILHDADEGAWINKICQHGLVDALSRHQGKESRPAYIGPESFTAAILDLLHPATPEKIRTIKEIQDGITALAAANPKLKESLTAIMDEAQGDLTQFKAKIGKWYDLSMDRVSGWYKKYAQRWLLILGLALAIFCNVDSIHIINALSSDPVLLQASVDQAVAFAKENPTPSAPSTPKADVKLSDLMDKTGDALSKLNSVKVPIGWNESQWEYFHKPGSNLAGWHLGHLLSAVMGWGNYRIGRISRRTVLVRYP